MKILAKDTKAVYIVPYSDSQEKTKVVKGKNIRMGEYEQGYGTAYWLKAYVSTPRGLATVDINGINVPEQRMMIVGKDCKYDNTIHEADIVLLPKSKLSQSADVVAGLLVDDGELSAFAKNDFYAYRISNISTFDYHNQFTITRIEV